MFESAFAKAVENAKVAQAKQSSDTKSKNNIENNTNQEYNENINHSLKNNGKNKGEQYGVMWTLGEGVLDNNEVSAFYEKISETKNNKYHNYHKAADGQLIYEINNKLIYTDGDYGHPHISKVVAFNTNDTYLLEYGRESFYDEEKYGYPTEAVVEVIEAVLGEGAVQTTTYSSYETNKRSGETGRKGKDSAATNRRGQNYVDNNSHNYSLKNATQISRQDVEDVQSIGRQSVNDFSKDDIKKIEVFARKYYQEMGEKSPFFRAWFGDWRANDTQMLSVVKTKKDVRRPINNKDTGWDINNSSKLHNELHNNVASIIGREYLPFANGIIENAVLLDSVISDKGGNSLMFHSFYAIARKETDTNNHLVKLLVEELYDPNGDTIKRGYKLIGFKEISPTVQKVHPNNGLASSLVSDNFSVADLFNFVKQNDKDFNPKPASVVVNKDGTPKVVYHGSGENFTAFDITKSRSWTGVPDYDLPGFYFSENKEDGASYGNVKEYYIKITNPYEGDLYALAKEKGSWRNAYEYLVKEGYDGVIVDEFGEGSYEYIVLKAENIKSATDNIGTFDKSNTNVSFSLKEKWHPDLTRQQVKMVEGWLQEEGSPESTRITDTANWYMGRISGRDLFVIYSNEDAKGSTILYESKGKQAKLEKDILMDLLEEIENGKSANGKSAYVNWVFSGGWMRQRNSIRHNISRLGSGQNNQNAGVLSGQPQGNPSAAFENVIRNLFKIQKRDGNKEHSLKGTVVDGEIASLVKKYGTIPKGENPAREIDVPRKTADGRKVSHTVRTILEAKATPDEALPSISELVTKGEFSYDAYTDKEAIAEAEEAITKKGWEQAKADWYKAVGKGEVSKRNTALGWAIYNNAVNSGEMETALEVLVS